MPQATNLHPTVCPSPMLRDVGKISSIPNKDPSAPPLSRGMWVAHHCSMEDLGNEEHHGGPRKQEARCVVEMGHDICYGSFSLIFPASNELTQPMSLKQQVATKKKTPTITTAETITTGMATTTAQPQPRPYPMPTVQPNA